MKMSFWSHCQSLILRLQQSRTAPRPRLRRQPSWLVESLEARTLLSSTPAMVADINPGAASSNPSSIVAIGSTTYFTASDGVHGQELWKSNGTAAGTMMIKDINPGGADGINPSASNLTNVNGTLFFTANDGVHGQELWKSDGTLAGATMVKDINPGGVSSNANNLANVNGTIFFTADDGVHGYELWKSDGTAAGTMMVADIRNTDSAGSYASNLTSMNGTLFFTANDGIHGDELWESDGTAAGTSLVKDIFPGTTFEYGGFYPNNSTPRDLTNVNGTLYFTANDGTAGYELWKSDGTEAGTTLVKDIFPGTSNYFYYDAPPVARPNSSNPNELTSINGTLYFLAVVDPLQGEELWKSNGTAAGTVMVPDINPGVGPFTNVNGILFFMGQGGLWKSDGTAAGTVLLSFDARGLNDPTIVNGTLFFTGDDGVHGDELWKTDGTAAGTTMVKDIFPGTRSTYYSYYGLYLNVPNSSWPRDLTNVNGTLFFTADDGVHGTELWTFPGVSGAPAPSLNVSGFPTTTTAGAAGSFTVAARNADGTTNAGYSGTVRFTTTDLQATIIDPTTGHAAALQDFTYTFTAADAGVHTFSATLNTAGTQSLTATDTLTPAETATEGGILVKSAAASTMTVTGFPSTSTAGVANNFTVTLKDPYGNVANSYTGTVHFTSTDAKATLPANYTFTAADAGKHTFSATLKTAGTRSITASDTLMSAFKATEGGITVNAAAASKFIITAPSTVTASVPFSLTLTVEDAYGNVVTGYTSKVHFTSTDKTALLPSNYTFTAADKGVHTFTGLVLRKKGKQTITITDTLNSSLIATVVENVS